MVIRVAFLKGNIEQAVTEVLVEIHDHGSLHHRVLGHRCHLLIQTCSKGVRMYEKLLCSAAHTVWLVLLFRNAHTAGGFLGQWLPPKAAIRT